MHDAILPSLTIYAAVAAVFAAIVGVGTLPALFIGSQGVNRPLRLPLFAGAGWGLAAIASAGIAVFDVDQTWPARGLLCLGLVLLIPFGDADRKRQQRNLLSDLVMLLILVAPMGLLVAATPATAFDEFAQWLPNTRYLVEHAHYWFWPDWVGASSKPGYPNASTIIALLTSQLIGPTIEAPFKVFAVILLGGFSCVLASFAAGWNETGVSPHWRARLLAVAFLAVGVLISFIDPFVDPRISLTAHTDTPTALILATAGLTASFGIEAARRGASSFAASWFTWTGLLSLTLVMTRTTNIVLVGGIFIAFVFLVIVSKAGSPTQWFRWAITLLGPSALGVLVWNIYLRAARIGADMAPRPLSGWDWDAPIIVLRAFILDRLSGNLILAALTGIFLVLAVVGGIVVWRNLDDEGTREMPSPRVLLPLTGIVATVFVIFIFWAYVAVFSREEVAAAASLWRYLTELGPLIVMVGCALGCEAGAATQPHQARPLAARNQRHCLPHGPGPSGGRAKLLWAGVPVS